MSAAHLLRSKILRYTTLAGVCGGSAWLLLPRRVATLHDSGSSQAWPSTDAALIGHARRVQNHFASTQPQQAQQHSKKDDAETIDHATNAETYSAAFEDDDENSWMQFSRNLDVVLDGIKRIEWAGLGDKITELVLPTWAKHLPESIQKLNSELSLKEGSLANEIWQEAHDPSINPEVLWNARVRVGNTLSNEELRFRKRRKEYMVEHFKKYMDIKEDVHPDDIPTIAICGSGGGLRALVAGTSSYLCTQEAGLFDCCTYTAGVSGSCWLQTLFFSSVGKQSHAVMLNHIKSRIGTHIAFPPPALKLLTSAPTSKFILSGFIEKLKGDPGASFGLVDAYSLLLAARLMVPKGDLDVQAKDLKLSNQSAYLKDGAYPMPIYTVVRHEIPIEEEVAAENPATPTDRAKAVARAKREAWFQWIELHPWEVFCEEFGAGIPTWSLGRPFEGGQNKILETGVALPEIRQSLLLGIYGSAFCATLAHYYKEVKPILSGLVGFGQLDSLLEEKNQDLVKIHPIDPATIPNFVYGMEGRLPETCPESVFKSDHLQVMDAGMSNNLPIYPLLRPGRDVDVLVAFDASADIKKENWLSVVDGYAKQRGIKSWPVGTGWPKQSLKPQENAEEFEEAQISSPQEAAKKFSQIRGGATEAQKQAQAQAVDANEPDSHARRGEQGELGHCSIWIGTKQERDSGDEPPPSKRLSWEDADDSSFQLMEPNATMAVVYFPLLPNKKVAGVDPDQTDYLSTWNFIYTPEQIDKVVELARTNFKEGEEATKRTIRAVYERKKASRLQLEDQSKLRSLRKKLKHDADMFRG
ncbi:hypothetical protein LTR64_000538 [Lithohypha guttulata]|uniref:uncharacterized protein n=1 Tax=Lithohypha guttulata TaxID=1690604 RepID=UPI002DDDE887|nr:hypothetical protein LTR51_005695 [Lithohypha guttulata]